MNLVCVDPAQAHKIWPQIENGVLDSLDRGVGGSIDALRDGVLSGDALMWLALSDGIILATVITELVETDDGLVCVIRSLFGENMREWFGYLKQIEQFAINEGCVSVQVIGRTGWKRVLRDYEYAQIGVIMEKELN